MSQIFPSSLFGRVLAAAVGVLSLCTMFPVSSQAQADATGLKGSERKAAQTVVRPQDFLTWGYLQSDTVLGGVRWQALTDIATEFVEFDSSGNLLNPNTFLNRSADLRANGVASRAGTRVHLLIANDNFSNPITESVMNSTTARTNLINNIVNLITTEKTGANTPGYVHGVSLDLEPFSWSSATAPNIKLFFEGLRSALDAAHPGMLITWYVDPTPSSNQFSQLPSFINSIDYIIYSAYDYGTGDAPRAISDYNDSLNSQELYLTTYGVPPEKMIIATSTYGRSYSGTTSYGVLGSGILTSMGFTDGLFSTTLRSTPYTENYVTGDETAWYTDGSSTYVYPGIRGLEFHTRQILSYGNSGSAYAGRKLGGIAFWSMMWLAETSSYDPIDAASVTQTRTYTHLYDIFQQALAPSGNRTILMEGFEGTNPRYEDPNHSPDTVGDTDADTWRTWDPAPGGTGRPASTVNAVRVMLEFESASGNRAFFRHEFLNHSSSTSIVDRNAAGGLMDSTSLIRAYVHAGPSATPTAYSNTRVALVVADRFRELERSAFTTLSAAGWQQLTFDLTGTVTGVNTSEPAFVDGDGVVETVGGGERDIAFVGFLIEDDGGANSVRTIWFDEVSHEHRNPGGANYVINEFREADTTRQFVEIYGPAGALPAGFQLRTFNSSTGAVANSYNLSGSIPDDGGGFGYYVVADPLVPNADFTNSGAGIVLPTTNPGSLQLYNTVTGGVYDSVVYMAHGGLGRLIAKETLGVADEGRPWLGKIGPGTDASSNAGTFGRYPDGTDTEINSSDFSVMKATPGAANGTVLSLPYSTNFASGPAEVLASYEGVKIASPVSSGIAANDGNALRVADTTGGGVINTIGDSSLGITGAYAVQGKVYLPASAAPAQAIGVGFCVTQGATFFTDLPAGSAYENGYWLIWENKSGVALADGQMDHPNIFQFVQASHDNQDSSITQVLGSATNASLGVNPGTWVNFRLVVNPSGPAGQQLLAQVNGRDVWRGSIPSGGRTSGAVAFGFRENHSGVPAASEGTWIDDLTISNDPGSTNIALIPVPVGLTEFELE